MSHKTTACFIPIKAHSVRVPGKNLRKLSGKCLFEWIIDVAIGSNAFDEIFVDTDSIIVKEYCARLPVKVIDRDPSLAQDSANGNDLLNYWYEQYSDFEYYFQLFATSPFTTIKTLAECVEVLRNDENVDSIFTAHEKCGWYWFNEKPINYDPAILPRSQDALKVVGETTALYGITNSALKENKCRIGKRPHIYFVDDIESIDIDSEFDFRIAEIIAKEYYA